MLVEAHIGGEGLPSEGRYVTFRVFVSALGWFYLASPRGQLRDIQVDTLVLRLMLCCLLINSMSFYDQCCRMRRC